MSDITPEQRAAAWNVVFLNERDKVFAGFYHDPTKNAISFADALQELDNTIEFTFGRDGNKYGREEWCWAIWPAQDYISRGASTVSQDSSEPPVPSMAMVIAPKRYYLLIHDNKCTLKHSGLFNKQRLKEGGCVSFVMKTKYVCSYDYKPPLPIARTEHKASLDNCLKRSMYTWSRHVSGDYTITSTVPRNTRSQMDDRLSLINRWDSFADRARNTNGCCAITGMGRVPLGGECYAIAPGFMLEAYHIVPPEHFDVYPVDNGSTNPEATVDVMQTAFDQTWTPAKNAILLLPHIYSLFRARLIAIHPETLQIRIFAPCELVDQYNGSLANFDGGRKPDKEALMWHWNMCVEENVKVKVSPWPSSLLRGHDAALPYVNGDDSVQFCTQKCLEGLKKRDRFDVNCPNFHKHAKSSRKTARWSSGFGASHPYIGQDKWTAVPPDSLVWSNRPESTSPKIELIPGKHGNTGHLVRITLAQGYVLVGKGMPLAQREWLEHEHNVYKHLETLQGTAVTTCLGLVRLKPPFQYTCNYVQKLESLLLQAWVGGTVSEAAGLSKAQRDENIWRSSYEVSRRGVGHTQQDKHLLWSEEVQRVMVIDFEKDVLDVLDR